MKTEKYELSKLTREQVETIVTKICKFDCIENFMQSHKKNPRALQNYEKNLIEMIDPNAKKGNNDVYARYHKDKDYISLAAWDQGCYWSVPVRLYKDHFEIPEYQTFKENISQKDLNRYTRMMNKFLKENREKTENKNSKKEMEMK